MKKVFCLILFVLFLFPTLSSAQQQLTRVVLKNNTALTGVLKEFNPTSYIIICISGIDSRIEMSDVLEVSQVDINSNNETFDNCALSTEGIPDELLLKEEKNYPASLMLDVAGEQVEMIHIKGGVFSMGYDERGSRRMNSEPIHPVFVSGFYISKNYITEGLAGKIYGKKVKEKKVNDAFTSCFWSDANDLVNKIALLTSFPVRLPTEAEWEYIVSQKEYRVLVNFEEDERDFCFDFWAMYPFEGDDEIVTLINPKGPQEGDAHIRRIYSKERRVYCSRSKIDEYSTHFALSHVRIVIPADNMTF